MHVSQKHSLCWRRDARNSSGETRPDTSPSQRHLRPRVQPRLTFPHILVWTGNEILRWISVCQAEVDQLLREVELSIRDAGRGRGLNVHRAGFCSQALIHWGRYVYSKGTGQGVHHASQIGPFGIIPISIETFKFFAPNAVFRE